jgi:hypothetical protein
MIDFRKLSIACLPAALLAGLTATTNRGLTLYSGTAAASTPSVAERVIPVTTSSGLQPMGSVRDVRTGIDTELVGFDWDGTSSGEIRLRALTPGGWSAWQTLNGESISGLDPAAKAVGHSRSSAGPVWVGHGVRRVQFQIVRGDVPGLRLDAIHSVGLAGSPTQAPISGVGQPPIITRAQWGADESWRTYAPGCNGSVSRADNVHFLVVHHTDSGNSYGPADSAAIIRGIYYFHTHTNLWCDIGYNFIVDQYGQIFEGRYGGITQAVIGAHAGGFNTGSSGIALLGTFTSVAPSAAMFSALRKLAGWEATIHGIDPVGSVTVRAGAFAGQRWPAGTDVTLRTIIGHRDVDYTDCPGNGAYAELPALRTDVAADVGTAYYRTWSGFVGIPAPAGSVIVGSPATSSWGIDRFDEFVRGSDNQLYHRWSNDGGSTFSGWELLGAPPGRLSSSPAAVSWGYGRVDVFVRGGTGALWHKWWGGTGWSGWEYLGGVLTSAPAVASWAAGRLDLFVEGVGHALFHEWYQAGWHGWENLGGVGAYDPGATSWGPGRVDLFIVGSDGRLWHKYYSAGWSNWGNDVPGRFTLGLGAASWGPGRVDVFTASSTSQKPMTHAWYGGGWRAESLGGSLASAPAAVSWLYNRVDVFVLGTNGTVYHDRWPGY